MESVGAREWRVGEEKNVRDFPFPGNSHLVMLSDYGSTPEGVTSVRSQNSFLKTPPHSPFPPHPECNKMLKPINGLTPVDK